MAIVFIIIVFGVPLAVLKYLGMRAMRPVSVDIAGPTLQQLVEAGTKASHSLARRMFSAPRAVPVEGGGALWEIRTGAGVMTVLIEPLDDAAGHRVTAQATSVRVVQARGEIDRHTDYGRAKIFTNWLFRLMGIPHNARKLLRQRRRVLRAVSRIGRVIPPAAPTRAALPQPADTPDAQLQ